MAIVPSFTSLLAWFTERRLRIEKGVGLSESLLLTDNPIVIKELESLGYKISKGIVDHGGREKLQS